MSTTILIILLLALLLILNATQTRKIEPLSPVEDILLTNQNVMQTQNQQLNNPVSEVFEQQQYLRTVSNTPSRGQTINRLPLDNPITDQFGMPSLDLADSTFRNYPPGTPAPGTTKSMVKSIPNEIMDRAAPNNIWVSEHNRIREAVGQSPVAWSQIIADGALKYAQQCKFAHSNQADRKFGNKLLGENLAYGSPYSRFDDTSIVRMWEDEKKYYKHPQYPGRGTSGETGHYTQIVNKNVTDIGCGCANCDGNKICVCRYNPIQIGNQYPY